MSQINLRAAIELVAYDSENTDNLPLAVYRARNSYTLDQVNGWETWGEAAKRIQVAYSTVLQASETEIYQALTEK